MVELTIAIPTYNRAPYLEQSLDTIRSQLSTDAEIEILVQDNASPDETPEVPGRFDTLPIRYERNEGNLGAFTNILRCCRRADGRWILFHADDDLLAEGGLDHLLGHLETDPPPGVITSGYPRFEDGDPDTNIGRIKYPPAEGETRLPAGPEALETLFLRSTVLSGLVVRTDLLDIEGARRHAESKYPQIYIAGKAAREEGLLYLAQPLVRIRTEATKYWDYPDDFLAGPVLDIARDLTRDQAWGDEAFRSIVRQRIKGSYSPLYQSRATSMRAYLSTVSSLASIPEYRKSGLFWLIALGVGILGPRGSDVVTGFWPGNPPDVAEA